MPLTNYELIETVKELAKLFVDSTDLFNAYNHAKVKLDNNYKSIERCKVKLGNHAKETQEPVIVQYGNFTALIHVPPQGYNDYAVNVQFLNPVKE